MFPLMVDPFSEGRLKQVDSIASPRPLHPFPLMSIVPITKKRLYNFDPLKPHFIIVKLGFTRVYIILFILLKNIDCGYSLEPPRRGGSNEYPKYIF